MSQYVLTAPDESRIVMVIMSDATADDDAARGHGDTTSGPEPEAATRQAELVEVIAVESDEEHAAHAEAEKEEEEEEEEPVVRLAASKIALLIGLHEFGDVSEAVLEYVYQNREELLEQDAKTLNLRVVSKDEELTELMEKTGASLAPQFAEILQWTRDRQRPVTQAAAAELLQSVDGLVTQARGKRKLKTEEAQEVKRQLGERIRLSYGCRNEDLALQTYEKQTGSGVRMSNKEFYFLRFPRLESSGDDGGAVDFNHVEQRIERRVVAKGGYGRQQHAEANEEKEEEEEVEDGEVAIDGSSGESQRHRESTRCPECYFSICGMIDGVADTLEIGEDDEWQLTPILLEVKNRMRAFRVPPPLYDYIQMAVYLKMIGLTAGDLVQCLHADRAQIHITRVALSEYPLSCKTPGATKRGTPEPGLWASVILPRLYSIVRAIAKIRENDLLRLAFLNGSDAERLAILRRECDFL